ncbi:MAG TPA: ROK family protein [Rectinemataceae bacterium]|nr:ROK family protein [Rectinemataceae bacterium]
MIVAAIEAGGTKFVLGLAKTDDAGLALPELLFRESIATTTPEETIDRSAKVLAAAGKRFGAPEALGIGCFGPVELRKDHFDWGHVTSTPKPLWRDADVATPLGEALGLKAAFDTDVNAAALGEGRWGAGRGLSDFIYVTVGTGIGGGVVSGGSIVHGSSHPELGHFKPARVEGDGYSGYCPYHGACLEGLASGPAIGARWGKRAEELPEGHPAWRMEAAYLARAFAAFACILSPQRIILGGGVGMRPGLAEEVAELVGIELKGYLGWLSEQSARKAFVVRPELGADAGLLGAVALAIGKSGD